VSLDLTIVTPQGDAYQGAVAAVVLPGSEGDFGVLEGHERFLSPLRIGAIEIRTPDHVRFAAISGGFADVSGREVVVLAETCELAEQIDVDRAEMARRRAEEQLERLREEQDENHRTRVYSAALERAVVRIQVAGRGT
jgi:F-type H+-transporting ATPase subunit epsilon